MTERRSGGPRCLDALPPWPGCLPLPLDSYDRCVDLTPAEAAALTVFVADRLDGAHNFRSTGVASLVGSLELGRLTAPLEAS